MLVEFCGCPAVCEATDSSVLASGAGRVKPADEKGGRTRTARLYDALSLLEGGISSVGHNGAHVSKHSSAE